MAERWIITPTGGDPVVLPTLTRNGGAVVVEQRTPPPPLRVQWAARQYGQIPTAREYENREVFLKLSLERADDEWWGYTHDFVEPPAEAEGDGDLPGWTGSVRRAAADGNPLTPIISDLSALVAALHARGGTATRVLDSGEPITFDVHVATDPAGPSWDDTFYVADRTTIEISLTCEPFGRGPEVAVAAGTKVSSRRFVETSGIVPGDVPALARIEWIDATAAQTSLIYAIDQPDNATAATGTEIPAVTLLPPPGATTVNKSGSVWPLVRQIAPFPAGTPVGRWGAVGFLRTTDGPPLALTGQFRVLARVWRDTTDPTLTLRLRWSGGAREAGMSANRPASASTTGWVLVDLGIVTVRGSLDGVIERQNPTTTSSTPPSTLALDMLLVLPTDRSAVATASTQTLDGVIVASDPLTGSGNLTGSSAPVGGAWAGYGAGADFVRSTGGATTSASPRAAGLAVGSANQEISARMRITSVTPGFDDVGHAGLAIGNAAGLAALYGSHGTPAPAGAWAVAALRYRGDGVEYFIGYVATEGQPVTQRDIINSPSVAPFSTAEQTLRLNHYNGVASATVEGGPLSGMRALAFATGLPNPPGSLLAAVLTRASATTFREFVVSGSEAPDRLLHPGRTATIASDHAERETPLGYVGTFLPEGDRPVLPPSGREGRPVRIIVGTSRADIRTGVEPNTGDAFDVEIRATPRWLQIPDTSAAEMTGLLPSSTLLPDPDVLPE